MRGVGDAAPTIRRAASRGVGAAISRPRTRETAGDDSPPVRGKWPKAKRGRDDFSYRGDSRRQKWAGTSPRPTLYNKEIVFKKRERPQDIASKNHPQNFVKNYEKNSKKALTHTGVLLYDSQAPVKGAVCDDVGDCSETR